MGYVWVLRSNFPVQLHNLHFPRWNKYIVSLIKAISQIHKQMWFSWTGREDVQYKGVGGTLLLFADDDVFFAASKLDPWHIRKQFTFSSIQVRRHASFLDEVRDLMHSWRSLSTLGSYLLVVGKKHERLTDWVKGNNRCASFWRCNRSSCFRKITLFTGMCRYP